MKTQRLFQLSEASIILTFDKSKGIWRGFLSDRASNYGLRDLLARDPCADRQLIQKSAGRLVRMLLTETKDIHSSAIEKAFEKEVRE